MCSHGNAFSSSKAVTGSNHLYIMSLQINFSLGGVFDKCIFIIKHEDFDHFVTPFKAARTISTSTPSQ